MVILGGGVVKHHIANACLMRNGAESAVYINTAQEFDGSDAGARPDEAVSWGKIKVGADSVKVCVFHLSHSRRNWNLLHKDQLINESTGLCGGNCVFPTHRSSHICQGCVQQQEALRIKTPTKPLCLLLPVKIEPVGTTLRNERRPFNARMPLTPMSSRIP